jgi:hypothetical protein
MKVFVNEKEITLFRGARVKDAVLSFDRKIRHKISSYQISDVYGNQTGLDGALQEGSKLFIKKINNI